MEILGDHLPAVTLLLRVRGNSEVELAALKRRRVIDDKLAGLVQAAVDEGSLRADISPELISRLLFGMVNSLVEWYRPDGPVPVEELSAAIVDLAFEGLGACRIVQYVLPLPDARAPAFRTGLSGDRATRRPAPPTELGDHGVIRCAGDGDVVQPGAAA